MSPEAQAALQQGQRHFFAEPADLAAAIAAFRRATELAPEWSEGFGWLASALQGHGELPEALKAATRAVELSKDDPRHWISMGTILLKLRHWNEAVRTLRRGVELKPHYAEADARLLLADALKGAGRLNEEREQLQIVAAMQPSYPSYDRPIEEAQRKLAATG